MDGLSAVATLIPIVQVSSQVINALRQYLVAFRDAESSCTALINQITLISTAAKAVESVVHNSPNTSRTPELRALIGEWFKADGPPAKCRRDLEELLLWLRNEVENRQPKKFIKRAVWPFKEKKLSATIQAFEAQLPYFRYILSIDNLNLTQAIAADLTRERERTRNSELTTTKLDLLKWLDGLDCTNKHDLTRRQRQETTGEWLLMEQLYSEWRNHSKQFLWLHGKAGSGKSVLASMVIDNLINTQARDEVLAYFYCDFRDSRSTSAAEVLRSLTTQLLRSSNNHWLSSFADLTTRKERGSGPPVDLGTLSDLLSRAVGLHEHPIIVVDALDECENLLGLLEELTKLNDGRSRLFLTSRTLHPIKVAFTSIPSISLDDKIDAVHRDMRFYIGKELESRDKLKALAKDLKDDVQIQLMKKADGMFRWVQCQLDRLNKCWSLGDVREVLKTLPTTLYETYAQMLHAIDTTEFGPRVARRALTWLVTAVQPLKLSQLEQALAISPDEPAWDYTYAPMHGTDILEICGSLVSFDEPEGIITLSHYSVKEFLTLDVAISSTYFVHQPRASLELASVSVHSIILYTEKPEPFPTQDDLLPYAIEVGFKHLANCIPDDNDQVLKLLFALQEHVASHRHLYTALRRLDREMIAVSQLALYIILRFGHPSMLQHYLDRYPVRVTQTDNPLVYAALYSDIPRVQLLLQKGPDANLMGTIHKSGDVLSLSPLTAAAHNTACDDRVALVKLLLEHGCIVPKDAIRSVLSIDGCNRDTHDIIRILLDHGADPTIFVAGGGGCLGLVRQSGLASEISRIARLLVGYGCDPTVPNDEGLSSYHFAIRDHDVELVQWLVDQGFQLPPDAILHACNRFLTGNDLGPRTLRMLHLLVANGAAVNVMDAEGSNALHIFVLRLCDYESKKSAIELLVEHGCNINCRNAEGETPLHLAATCAEDLSIVELLLDHGANLPDNLVNYAVQFPWPFASSEKWVETVLLPLVKIHKESCRRQSISGENVLHSMIKSEAPIWKPSITLKDAMLTVLLENGCDVRATNRSGDTPLQVAIENGYLSIADRLVESYGWPLPPDAIKPCGTDARGNGVLHRLCYKLYGFWRIDEYEFMPRAERLQAAGYDHTRQINQPNNQGFTPLCIALGNCYLGESPAIIEHLLSLGARFSDVNPLYLDNIEWATDRPWYDDAADAHQRALSRPHPTFDDVTLVYHLLRVVGQSGLPPSIVKFIMDLAGYWAHTSVVKTGIAHTIAYRGESIALPAFPSEPESWTPRRVTLSCKVSDIDLYDYVSASIKVRLRRRNTLYAIPAFPHVDRFDPRRVDYDVWDQFTPASQLNGRQKLSVANLRPDDMLRIDLKTKYENLELKFFRVEMYFALGRGRQMFTQSAPSSM